jgi:UDP-glucose 4-epimerase
MTTCLIGGAGFIGRAVTRQLLAAGRKIIIMDIGTRPTELDPRIDYIQGDYGNKIFLTEALQGVDEIVLLAYASVPKTSFEDPLSDLTSNLPPALVLFDVARNLPLKKLIILSSGGTVYGKVAHVPIDEATATNPISPYGITKLAIEKYANLYHELYELPAVILRPANAYGEGQRPFTGQGFIATAVASVLTGKVLTMFGEAGSVRDYIHVDDIASSICAALDKGEAGACYNVGTGKGTSNSEVLEMINQLATPMGLMANVSIQSERRFDVPANILNSTKLTEATGWTPSVTLEEGLQRVWDWSKAHETA